MRASWFGPTGLVLITAACVGAAGCGASPGSGTSTYSVDASQGTGDGASLNLGTHDAAGGDVEAQA
ncbi:MAG: hypothetical protein ACRENE_17030, partial [Polyangiaceae bacterium]